MELSDKQIDELLEAVERNAQMIQKSGMFLQIYAEDQTKDPIALIQLALAILMDKPLLILAPEGTRINDKLRRVADDITFFVPGDPEQLKAVTVKMLLRQMEKMEKH